MAHIFWDFFYYFLIVSGDEYIISWGTVLCNDFIQVVFWNCFFCWKGSSVRTNDKWMRKDLMNSQFSFVLLKTLIFHLELFRMFNLIYNQKQMMIEQSRSNNIIFSPHWVHKPLYNDKSHICIQFDSINPFPILSLNSHKTRSYQASLHFIHFVFP